MIESFNCKECNNALFYFFSVNQELHTLCRECGRIVLLEELRSELRDSKIMGIDYTKLKEGSKRR